MTTLSISEVRDSLNELVHGLAPGDEVLITENDQPVARLLPVTGSLVARELGTLRGSVLEMTDDFDTPLPEFSEYTP